MHTLPDTPTPSTCAVGDITVHRIDETPLPPATGPWLLPGATPEVVAGQDWLRPHFAGDDGILHIDSHSFAFAVDGLRVLVDTGNGKERANPAWHNLRTDFPERLTAAGFPPGSVDLVVLTHLHADHVGWNTRKVNDEWVPTFPEARYLTARAEREFWAAYDMEEARRQMFRDSVIPVEQAGLLDLVDVPAEGVHITPSLSLVPAPGHVAVELNSQGDTALITGDCIHHPVQLAHSAIGACVGIDPQQSETTRGERLASLAGTDTLLLGTHFAPPTAGRVVAHGDAYRLRPAPTT
ncbi:MBL fold metallo-hydrolase [Streptomyces sp. PAL114]|uniref:MBL fold metallo-hydrolase n=1 Tax=Streptomyces sp. PAL114 TaxID=2970893 RepID=UPI0028FD9C14|nr:MBL fold metallo-hydrolase [Streptomyces sp. PAL114]MDU0300790.1 MBL fold metallo-hydrolase [Streptomyces sp. PAL114]